MSSKKSMILGYTRTGIEVRVPTDGDPDVRSLSGWTRGDHLDAARILREHSEREREHTVGVWCFHWAKAHKAKAKSRRSRLRVLGAAETAILRRRGN